MSETNSKGQRIINRGFVAGDNLGESGFSGAGKINDNFTDLFEAYPTIQNVNRIISGQVVWTGTGLVYMAVNLKYELDGQIYNVNADQVTLTAADVTDPRIDVIVVDVEGLAKVTGTASTTPAEPSIDLATQIKTNIVYIPANNTTPDGVTISEVYEENLQETGGEWDSSETSESTGFDLANTTSPLYGTKDIKTGIMYSGDKLLFENTTAVTMASLNHIKFSFKALNYWGYDRVIVRLKNDGVQVAADIIDGSKLDTTDDTIIQDVYVFTGSYVGNVTSEFNEIELEIIAEITKTSTSPYLSDIAFQLDNIYIQTGDEVTEPTPDLNVGIANFAPELKATHQQGTDTEVNISNGVHFECTKQTADKTMTFINPVENKMIKMTVNLDSNALTLTGIDVTKLDLDGGDTWETFLIEWTKVGGVLKAKALNHAVWA